MVTAYSRDPLQEMVTAPSRDPQCVFLYFVMPMVTAKVRDPSATKLGGNFGANFVPKWSRPGHGPSP